MDAFLFLVIFMIGVYICWNCRINRSLVILIGLLGVSIYVLALMGNEPFVDEQEFDSSQLEGAGLVRPSLFNCTKLIGKSPEVDAMYSDPNKDM